MNNSPLAMLCAVLSLAALVAGFSGQAALVGMSAVALIVVLSAIGLRAPGRPRWPVLSVLLAWGAIFCGLLALGFHLHDPATPLTTFGGFPVGTATLVYGTTPLGITMGVLYGLAFERDILPLDEQREFLDRFASK